MRRDGLICDQIIDHFETVARAATAVDVLTLLEAVAHALRETPSRERPSRRGSARVIMAPRSGFAIDVHAAMDIAETL